MNSLTYISAIGLAVALLAGGTAGCQTASPSRDGERRVMVHPDGSVSVDGRVTKIEDMPGRLRSAGFEESASVYIGIPEQPSTAILTKVSSVLASSGYQRVVFVKPRTTRVGGDKSAAQQQQPAMPAKSAKTAAHQ